MSVIEHITTIVEDGLTDLLSQFDKSPRLKQLIEAALVEVQRAEDWIHAIGQARLLENAVGAILDRYAGIVEFPRAGLSDVDYRKMVQVAGQINRHDAQADDTARIWGLLIDLDGAVPIRYAQMGIAHFGLWWTTAAEQSDEWLDFIVALMPRLAGLGVSWELVESVDPGFIFDDADRGFDQGLMGRRVDV